MLVALEVESGSSLAGSTVAVGLGGVEGVTAVAVLRDEEMVVPRGPTAIEAGDQLVVIATERGREQLAGLVSARSPSPAPTRSR